MEAYDTPLRINDTFLWRFWKNVKVGETPDDCWEWQGNQTGFGYGQIRLGGRGFDQSPAHRIMWTICCGPVPDGLWVLHKCDNPPCVYPEHLFLGTAADNMRDAANKGRLRSGDNHPMRINPSLSGFVKDPMRAPRGEDHWRTILTREQGYEVRARYQMGETQGAIARDFGVSRAVVQRICAGTSWLLK